MRLNRRARFRRIVLLFVRLVLSFAWAYLIDRILTGAYSFSADSKRNRQRARWIRTTAIEMGGVIIKVGQFLSTRVDLLPEEYIEELSLLQDEVPPVPFAEVEAEVEASFRRPVAEVFQSFETGPLASASLGQTYRALLPSGTAVVVKVRRPGIEQVVEADLSALGFVVNQLSHIRFVRRRVDLPGILREFTQTLREELNYGSEAHNAERIRYNLAGNAKVVVPRIFWSHTVGNVITLEHTPGVKINDYEAIEAAGINRSELAETLLATYLDQIIHDGFFHADPHPGNVFARMGGVIVLVDFGMMGGLSVPTRRHLRELFLGIATRNLDQIVGALRRLRFIRPDSDLLLVRNTVAWSIDTFYGMSFAELRDVDPREVLEGTFDVFRAGSFQIPTSFAFLGRAIGTLLGLCTGLDPSFRFNEIAAPYARRLIEGDRSLAARLDAVMGQVRQFAITTASLPGLSQQALQSISYGDWIRRDLNSLTDATRRVERMVRGLLLGILAMGFLIVGAGLDAHEHGLAVVALIVGCLLLLRVVILMLTSRRAN